MVLCRKLASCLLPCTSPSPLKQRCQAARCPRTCPLCQLCQPLSFPAFSVPLHRRHILSTSSYLDVIAWPFTSIHTYIFQLLYYICGLYPIMGWESGPQMNESGSSICSHVLSQEALKSVQHEIWTKQENFEQLGAGKVKFVQ